MKEKVVKTLKTFYDLMTMFTKYVCRPLHANVREIALRLVDAQPCEQLPTTYIHCGDTKVQAAFAKGQAVAERPWHKLLQSVGLELSQHIYTLINWFNHSDDGENQRDKKKKATMKVRAFFSSNWRDSHYNIYSLLPGAD